MRHFASAISRTEASNRRVAVAAGATTSKHALGNHHLGALVQFSLGLSGTQCQISVRQDSGRQRLIEARGTMAHTRLRCQVSSVSLGAWTSGYPQGWLAGSSSGLRFTCKLAHRSPPCRIRSFAVNTSLIGLRACIFVDSGSPGSLDLRQAYVLSGGLRPHISIATHSWQYTRAYSRISKD